MRNNINKLFFIIDSKYYLSFLFILLGIIFAGILDVLSITLLPLFISLVVQPDIFFENLIYYLGNYEFINSINYQDFLFYFSIMILSLFFLKSFLQITVIYFENLFLLKITTDLGHKIFNNLLNKNYLYHIKVNKSVILNTLSTELDRTRFYMWAFINVVKDVMLMLIFLIVLIYWIGFYIPFLSIIFLGIVGYIVYKTTRSNIQKRGHIALQYREKQNKVISHSLSSIKEVIIYKSQSYFLKSFDQHLKGNQFQQIFNSVFNNIPKPVLEIASLIVILSIVAFYIRIDSSEDILTTISLLAVSLIRVLPAVNSITASLLNMKFNTASVDIIYNYLKDTVTKNKKILSSPIEFKKINFNKVSFEYNLDKEIIKNANLEIIAGTSNAIIGASGSGKTTIINLMLGLINPTNGSININTSDISECLDSFRDLLGYVPQNVYLMEDTITKNIAFASKDNFIDMEKIKHICKISQLDGFISNLPNRFDTMLGENGLNISGGQIQRIGIARALYRDPKIIVLDESTSALDIETEAKIIESILKMKEKLTIIFISHRTNSIKNFDNIFKIESKKINIIKKKY